MRVRGNTYGSTDGNKSNDKLVIQARLVPGLRHSHSIKASSNTRKRKKKRKGKSQNEIDLKTRKTVAIGKVTLSAAKGFLQHPHPSNRFLDRRMLEQRCRCQIRSLVLRAGMIGVASCYVNAA
jgi:hypothetical protein